MPKTRTEAERQEKADEILNAAIAHLRRGGVEAVSVAALARELGVAQNTIYWYFPSRDHLLVAALARMAERVISEGAAADLAADGAPKPQTTREAVLLAVDRFASIQPLMMSLRERGGSSPVIRDFDARLRDFLRRALREAFEPFVPEPQIDLSIDTFMLASDGCYTRGLQQAERRAVLGFVLDRLGITEEAEDRK